MTAPSIDGAAERLAVGVTAPHRDAGAVRTDLRIDRWDEDQTRWALRRVEREGSRARTLLCQADPNGHAEPTSRFFRHFRVEPYLSTVDENCNMIVSTGWAALLGGIAGTSIGAKFGAANGRIGVGTSATAAAATQTFLVGDTGSASTTSYYQLVSGAPVISTASAPATLTLTASFGTGVANFAWAEFGSDNATTSTVNLNGLAGGFIFLNRGVSSQGTKASGQTWTATESISLGFPSGSGTVS